MLHVVLWEVKEVCNEFCCRLKVLGKARENWTTPGIYKTVEKG